MKARILTILTVVALTVMYVGGASNAFAYNETGWTGAGICGVTCHISGVGIPGVNYGPHGGYSSGTKVCKVCHTLHDAPTSNSLLLGETVKAACQVCHDGTAGRGVYGAIAQRGLPVGGQHKIETTSMVPGGSASTGGSVPMAFSGPNSTLTCSDCHSPHAKNCVTPFLGERQRMPEGGLYPVGTSNRLLKQRPGGVTTAVAEYGSDWCLACHQGRSSSLPAVMNHPVEASATVAAPYNYRRLGIIGPGPYPTSETTIGAAGINTQFSSYNRAYLMPFPRTGAQAGHLPICQQCHEDERYVGDLTASGTQATPSESTATFLPVGGDGRNAADNPRFQNFPHEAQGFRMLVEADTTAQTDDLCLNCHPQAGLP
ncbi:MAG: hypothetical protein Q8S43_02725 [Actinomycetota bacterium]|nr:hypothetical protein [Actinomycetota bacterium]MDP3629856.1 hypothetical protein [Actinomycetota bacterium]